MENTLLYGNGLNQLTNDGPAWDELLEKLKGNNKFQHNKLTNTMIYERIFLERDKPNLEQEEYIKEEVASLMGEIKGGKFYQKIIDLNLKNYITTNYDYAFGRTLGRDKINENTEKVYSIRRNLDFEDMKVWHIHGELENPKSIQLGLDHYSGYIGKIDAYLKGKYEYTKDGKAIKVKRIEDKIRNNLYDGVSWIELFFNTNIHILGFGLDYSEIDLWWILNKRARLMINNGNINNKIIFYTNKIDEQKEGLLRSFKVDVQTINKYNSTTLNNSNNEETDYIKFTLDVIDKIARFQN